MLVHDADFPDPFLLPLADGKGIGPARPVVYAYGTNANGHNVQVLRSRDPDLRVWQPLGDALPQLPAWAAGGRTWSPAVLAGPDGFVLYVVVAEPRLDRQAIAVATADRPEGPFHPVEDAPLVYQRRRGGSIDPDPFVDDDGTAYLLWKSDDNALGRRTSLWGQPLRPDGLGFAVRRASRLLRLDAPWERPLVEGPSLVRVGPTYHLFYSGGWWESGGYGIGHALAIGSALGPYRRTTLEGPWLGTGGDLAGPGGQSVTRVGDRLVMAFQAWEPGRVGYPRGGRRGLHLGELRFDGETAGLLL